MMADEVRSGLGRGEMFLLYQPQVSADGRTIVAVEALIRWRRPGIGVVAPDAFIPLAERSTLINDIGRFALSTAARDSLRWPGLLVAVNVSAVEFAAGYAEAARDIVLAQGADPRRIELELTESALMNDPELCRIEIERLRGYGFRIALDDFGAGYSSLSYVSRLPVDVIKLDRSYVAAFDPDAPRNAETEKRRALARAVVTLARGLGVELVAEGVETMAVADAMRGLGVRYAQGWAFAPAMPAEAACAWFARFHAAPPSRQEPARLSIVA